MEVRTLDQFFVAARPLIEEQVALAEKAADLGKAAREVGFEWSQIKAVLKATILDEGDGGERVTKLVGKNECGIAYADIAAKVNKKKFLEPPKTEMPRIDTSDRPFALPYDDSIPPFLDRRHEAKQAAE